MSEAARAKTTETPDPVDVPCYGADGSEQGTRSFAAGPVSNYPNVALLKEAVRRIQGRQRSGTAKTKGRAEVNGSNRKPWRQKGTGRARAGTRRSPIWRGGGTVFGPQPRKYDYGLPKKQRRLAIRHALLSKLLDGEAKVVQGLPAGGKTKELSALLQKIGSPRSCLIGIDDSLDKAQVQQIVRSCRNLDRVEILPVRDFNVLALLKNRTLLLTSGAFDQVQSAESAQGGSQ